MGVDPEVVDVHDQLNVQRPRKLATRQERDETATHHPREVEVVGGDDLPVTHAETEASVGGVGDG